MAVTDGEMDKLIKKSDKVSIDDLMDVEEAEEIIICVHNGLARNNMAVPEVNFRVRYYTPLGLPLERSQAKQIHNDLCQGNPVDYILQVDYTKGEIISTHTLGGDEKFSFLNEFVDNNTVMKKLDLSQGMTLSELVEALYKKQRVQENVLVHFLACND